MSTNDFIIACSLLDEFQIQLDHAPGGWRTRILRLRKLILERRYVQAYLILFTFASPTYDGACLVIPARPEPSHAVTGAWRLLRKAAELVQPVQIMPTDAELQALVDELYA